MLSKSNTGLLRLGLLGLMLAAPVHAGNINKRIDIAAGTESGSQSSVNGSITVGNSATVNGSLETVNGTIRIEDSARVRDLETVNGSIRIGSNASTGDISGVNGSISLEENVVVDGGISVVNGRISMQRGSRIERNVSNVNGEFEIVGSEIGGNLSTVNGDVLLTDRSVLQGDLLIEKSSGWSSKRQRKLRVVIGPGTRIVGKVHLERKVELFIHESATVGGVSGEMSLDEAVRFSGNRP